MSSTSRIDLYGSDSDPFTTIYTTINGRILAGTSRGEIHVWEFKTSGKAQRILRGHTDRINVIACNSSLIFSASDDETIKIWELESGKLTKTIDGHCGKVTALCYSFEDRLYSGGSDGTINEWDYFNGNRKWILTGSVGSIGKIIASPLHPQYLFSVAEEGAIRKWNVKRGQCVNELVGHTANILDIVIDGQFMYSTSVDSSIRIWNIDESACVHTIVRSTAVPLTQLSITSNLLYGTSGDLVELYDLNAKKMIEIVAVPSTWTFMTKSADGSVLYSTEDGLIKSMRLVRRNSDLGLSTSTTVDKKIAKVPQMTAGNTAEEQLRKFKEMAKEQERTNTALREKLLKAQYVINNLKTQVSTKQNVVEELSAAKDLLVSYSADLKNIEEANAETLKFMFNKCDEELKLSSSELMQFEKLAEQLDKQYFSPSVNHRYTDFRSWELDSDWDSDVDNSEEMIWWRSGPDATKLTEVYFCKEPEEVSSEDDFEIPNAIVVKPNLAKVEDELKSNETKKDETGVHLAKTKAKLSVEINNPARVSRLSMQSAFTAGTLYHGLKSIFSPISFEEFVQSNTAVQISTQNEGKPVDQKGTSWNLIPDWLVSEQ